MDKKRNTFSKIKRYSPFLGLLLFIFIVSKIDLKQLYRVLLVSELKFVFFSACIAPIILLVMAIRWHVILKASGIEYPLRDASTSLIKGSLLGVVTPGRLGELTKIKFLLEGTNCSIGKSVFSVVIDRIYDLLVLLIIAGISSIFLVNIYAVNMPVCPIIAFSIGLILLSAFLFTPRFMKPILNLMCQFLISPKHRRGLHFHVREFYSSLQLLTPTDHIVCCLLSIFIWQLKFAGLYFLTRALRIPVPFWFVFLIGSIVAIIGILPISISGFGTREAVFIFFLSLHQITAEFAVALSVLYFVFGLWGIFIPGGFVYVREIITLSNYSPNRSP